MTLTEALQHGNVQAFLHMLRKGEGTSDPDGYRRLFGGSAKDLTYRHFVSFADHPRQAFMSAWGWTSAAGAYQAMCAVPPKTKVDTWGDFIRAEGPHDFSPESQDLFATWCIRRAKALDDVVAGRFDAAVAKCCRTWASLPGSPYGQPMVTMAQIRNVYEQHGGTYTDSITSAAVQTPEPQPLPTPTPQPQQEKTVAPFILAALPALFEAVPKLINIFGSGSEVAKRNEAAVQMAVDIAKTAVGAPNEQALVEVLKADPAAAQAVRQAMEENWFQLVEVGGGIEAARKANEVYLQPGTKGFWHNPAFIISCLLLAMPFMLLVDLFYVHPTLYVGEIRTQVITGLLAVIMMVGGYWIGTSFSSSKKDERPAG